MAGQGAVALGAVPLGRPAVVLGSTVPVPAAAPPGKADGAGVSPDSADCRTLRKRRGDRPARL
jgi:hypothetical protein